MDEVEACDLEEAGLLSCWAAGLGTTSQAWVDRLWLIAVTWLRLRVPGHSRTYLSNGKNEVLQWYFAFRISHFAFGIC